MKAEKLKSSRSNLCFDDPRPAKYRRMEGYADHVQNVLINYMSTSSTEMAYKLPYTQSRLAGTFFIDFVIILHLPNFHHIFSFYISICFQ